MNRAQGPRGPGAHTRGPELGANSSTKFLPCHLRKCFNWVCEISATGDDAAGCSSTCIQLLVLDYQLHSKRRGHGCQAPVPECDAGVLPGPSGPQWGSAGLGGAPGFRGIGAVSLTPPVPLRCPTRDASLHVACQAGTEAKKNKKRNQINKMPSNPCLHNMIISTQT